MSNSDAVTGPGTATPLVTSGIQYFQTKDFDKSFQQALLEGGHGKKAWGKVRAILGGLTDENPFEGVVSRTNHGESRVDHCVKYDLGIGWRLITYQHQKTCGFLFLGKHEKAERWLENNKGQRFAVEGRRATLVPGAGAQVPIGRPLRAGDRPLFELLPSTLSDHLFTEIPRSIARELEDLDASAGSVHLDAIAARIEDSDRAALIPAVFNQLIAGNVEGAGNIVKLHMGAITEFEELDQEELLEVEDGPEIRRLKIGSEEHEEWLQGFERRSMWYEWFLFLHPEQERVVLADYSGPAQLSGVSGSGKTCVAVRRALRIAQRKGSRILLVTLNRSLAGLLQQLVEAVGADEDVKNRIDVTSFFQLAQRLLKRFEPENEKIYLDVTWKLEEHVDEVFREYYRQWLNCSDAKVLLPLHQSLNARGVSGEIYLREEFDWIRSAVSPRDTAQYLEMPRRGRRFPIVSDRRQDVLDGLIGWEAKMRHVGVVDYLGLTSALSRHINRIEREYDYALIDEAQDFGTTELQIIRRLVAEGPNDIFLCGDIAQTILPKHRSLKEAGIFSVERDRITRNYRNSRHILTAAYDLLRHNLHEDMLDSEDLEILDPKLANFSGSIPMALYAESLEEEIAFARTYAATRLDQGVKTVCVGFAGFTTRDIAAFAKRCGVTALDSTYDPSEDRFVFSDLEQTKGYEFETLIIVQCTASVLPPLDEPEEEAHRAACKLYVAMTRARRELILSFHGQASPWITAVSDSIATGIWSDFEDLKPELLDGTPERLPEIHPDNEVVDPFNLAADQFLYTNHALGMSMEAQQKLVELVDGRGAIQGGTGRQLRWADVGSLIADLSRDRTYERRCGPVVAKELRSLRETRPLGR